MSFKKAKLVGKKFVAGLIIVVLFISTYCTPFSEAIMTAHAAGLEETTEAPVTTEESAPTEEPADSELSEIVYEDIKGTELIEERTASNKFFILENGEKQAVLYGYPVHYLKDGKYVDIDNSLSLVVGSDGKEKYVNKENAFQVEISTKSDGASISKGNYQLSWTIDGIDTTKSGNDVKVNLTNQNWSEMKEGEKRSNRPNIASGIVFKSIKAGVDLQYVVVSNKIKENIILNEYTSIDLITQRIKAKNLELTKNEDGSLTAYDPNTKEVIFEIPTPIVTDSEGNVNYIGVALEKKGNNYILTYKLDTEWLKTAIYPVVIDPTIANPYPVPDGSTNDAYIWDNRIAQSLATTNYKDSYMMCTGNGSSSGINYSLIKFTQFPDLSGCTIDHAYLTVIMNNTATVSSNVGACKITSPWTEAVTWNSQPTFNPTPEYVKLVGTKNLVAHTWDIPAMANDWKYTNYGVLLKDMGTAYKGWATWQGAYDDGPKLVLYFHDSAAPNNPSSVTCLETSHSGSTVYATVNFPAVTDPGTNATGVRNYVISEKNNKVLPQSILTTQYYNAGTGRYEVPFTLLDNTSYQFHVTAYDFADNPKDPQYCGTDSALFTTPDYSGPTTINVTLKNNQGTVISGPTKETLINVNWQMTDPGDHLQTIWYAIYKEGTLVQNYLQATWTPTQPVNHVYTGSFSVNFANSITYPDSTYEIRVKGKDFSNDGTYAAVLYTKDTIIDTLTLAIQSGDFTQSNNQILVSKSQINVLVTVGDSHSIQSWTLEYGEGSSPSTFVRLKQENTAYNGSYNWDLSALPNKIYTLRLSAKDGANNELPVRLLTFQKVFIGIPATLQLDTPPENQGTIQTQDVNVTYSLLDGNSTSSFAGNLYVNNELQQPADVQNGGGFTIDMTQEVDGTPKYPEGSFISFFISANDGTYDYYSSATDEYTPFNDEFTNSNGIDSDPQKSYGYQISGNAVKLAAEATEGAIVSKALPTDGGILSGGIAWLQLSTTQTVPTGTGIQYFISGDGGQSWITLDPNVKVYTPQIGYKLRLKALFTSDGTTTPVLDDWKLTVRLSYFKDIIPYNYQFYKTENGLRGLSGVEKICDDANTIHKIELQKNPDDLMHYFATGSFRTERKVLAGKVTQVCLTTSATNESYITYRVSADNGVHWQKIYPSTTGTPTVLEYPGTTLIMEVIIDRVSETVSPSLDSMSLQVYQDILGDRIMSVQLITPPSNLTARAKINYKTLLTWDAPKLPNGEDDPNVTYNVYKKKCSSPSDSYFEPGDAGVICISGIKDTFYSDFNIDYGATYYYLVTAVKEFDVGESTIVRESTPTSNVYATVVSQSELDKQLGLEDYWGYVGFRSGAGDGYININTGNLVYQATDLVVTGPRLAMVMRRTYNSQSTSRSALGDGWDFSFNTCLLKEYEPDGITEKGLILKDGDGSIHRFTDSDNDGIYNSNEHIFMTITRIAKTDENGVYYEYKLTRKDNIEYNFDRNLLLTSFSEPNGNRIYLHYDHRGNVDKVSNDVDDSIYLLYDKGDRLYAVTDGTPEYSNEGEVINIIGGRTYIYEQVDPDDLRDVQLRSAALWDRSGENSTWENRVLTHKDKYWYYLVGSKLAYIFDPKSTANDDNVHTVLNYNYFTEADGTQLPVISKVEEPNNDYFEVNLTGDNASTSKFDPTGTVITDNYTRSISYVHNASGQITQVTDALGKSVSYAYGSSLNPYAPTEIRYRTQVYYSDTEPYADTDIISSYGYNINGDVIFAKTESQKVGSSAKTLLSYTSYEYYLNDTNPYKNNKLHYVKVQKDETDTSDILTTEYDYDAYGNLTYVKASPSEDGGSYRITRYTYYHDNLMNGTTVEQYRIGLQESTTDEFYGKRTVYTYDEKGRLHQTEVKIGSSGSFNTISTSGTITYDEFNQPEVVTDELGYMTAYKYDAFGLPLEIKQQKNDHGEIVDLSVTTFQYDQNFNLIYQTSGKGADLSKTYFAYDVMDRLIATWQLVKIDTVNGQDVEKYIVGLNSYQTTLGGEDIMKSYAVKDYIEIADESNRAQQIQNLMGLSTNYVTESRYDKGGRLTKTIVNGVTMAENTLFDDSGNVLAQKITVDAPTNEYRYNNAYYDALGRAVKTVADVGGKNTTTTATYDFFGLETKTKDPLGKETINNYDYFGRLTKVTLPTKSDGVHNDITQYQYDITGNINGQTVFGNKVIDANGHETITWMDRAGRKVREDTIADNGAFNLYKTYTYGDPNGSTDETQGYTTQIKKVQRNDKFVIDPNTSQKTGRTNGSFELYYYDDMGRIDTVAYKNTEGAGSDYIHYEYNNLGYTTLGVLHKAVNGDVIEEITATTPDILGRTIDATESKEVNGVVEDGSLHIGFEYDAWSNVTKTAHTLNDNGASARTTQYVYNSDNMLQDVLYDDAGATPKPARHYTYRTDGSVDTITDYREFSLTGAYITRAYDYYSNGQVSTITYTDSTSNDTAKKRETHTLTYYGNGLVQGEHIVNEYTGKNMKDITKAYTYDDIGRLLTSNITVQDGSQTNTLSDTYTYDAVGNRLTMHYVRTGEDADNYTLSYNYNELNQLTNITRTGVTGNFSTFEYDGKGNQVKEVTKEKDLQDNYHDITMEFEYDLMGNMVKLVQTPTYTYNSTRSMTQTNEYNASGQRVSKTEVTVQKSSQHPSDPDYDITLTPETARYYYSGNALLFSTHNDLEENILTPGGQVIASQRMDNPYDGDYLFYNYDKRGSTSNLIDPDDGQSVQNYVYDEFGNVTESQETTNNELQYTGSVKDSKSGLNYMNSRFYEPSTGRFLSQDSYTGNAYSPMTQHLYSYTGNSPTNFVDPTGHEGVVDAYYYNLRTNDDNIITQYWSLGSDYFTDYWYTDPDKLDQAIFMLKLEADAYGGLDTTTLSLGPKEELLERLSNDPSIINGLVNRLQIEYEDAWRLSSDNIQKLYDLEREDVLNSAVLDGIAMIGQGIEILLAGWLSTYAENTAARNYGSTSGAGLADAELEAGLTINRPLAASDLGLAESQLTELTGTFEVANGTATVSVDYIAGDLGAGSLKVIPSLKSLAQAEGANTLIIRGTLGNVDLMEVLSRRYGGYYSGAAGGYTDSYTFPLN